MPAGALTSLASGISISNPQVLATRLFLIVGASLSNCSMIVAWWTIGFCSRSFLKPSPFSVVASLSHTRSCVSYRARALIMSSFVILTLYIMSRILVAGCWLIGFSSTLSPVTYPSRFITIFSWLRSTLMHPYTSLSPSTLDASSTANR